MRQGIRSTVTKEKEESHKDKKEAEAAMAAGELELGVLPKVVTATELAEKEALMEDGANSADSEGSSGASSFGVGADKRKRRRKRPLSSIAPESARKKRASVAGLSPGRPAPPAQLALTSKPHDHEAAAPSPGCERQTAMDGFGEEDGQAKENSEKHFVLEEAKKYMQTEGSFFVCSTILMLVQQGGSFAGS